MQHDDVIWNVLKHSFCSYKVKTRTQVLCRNPYNQLGVCGHSVCPLANSNYATVLEENGKLVLCIKTVERAHMPARLWERIELPENRTKAFEEVDKHLEWWPKKQIVRCKLRVIRLQEVLRNTRRVRLRNTSKLVRIHKKDERRLEKRELKALRAAKLEMSIEKELLNRLQQGAYDSTIPVHVTDEIIKKVAMETLEEEEQEELNKHKKLEEEEEEEFEAAESDEEVEQVVDESEEEALEEERPKKRQKVLLEIERERAVVSNMFDW
jgi:protein MAK16